MLLESDMLLECDGLESVELCDETHFGLEWCMALHKSVIY